ncbi:hypothetical protein T07_13563 [Trichinella nelsoni]|uniref:Uncharacterized protein n=1 Tax=Trichinella nelsoni TaxID=6336 RepID=A0A0V0RT72_9BILA|nr:hypothetical protein T07_13563 [Trichinella nelsoni]
MRFTNTLTFCCFRIFCPVCQRLDFEFTAKLEVCKRVDSGESFRKIAGNFVVVLELCPQFQIFVCGLTMRTALNAEFTSSPSENHTSTCSFDMHAFCLSSVTSMYFSSTVCRVASQAYLI